MKRAGWFSIVIGLSVVVACGGNTQGTGSPGGGNGGSAGASGTPASTGLVGTWSGYVENYQFSDQTDVITVAITNAQGDGHMVVGSAAPPPPPTDPNVGYPPGVSFQSPGAMQSALWPGFAYTILNPSFNGQRLQFDVASTELWQAWCAMQTPIADTTNPGSYMCVPNWGASSGSGSCYQTDPQTNQNVPIDCGKLYLCEMGPCRCTATACSVSLQGNVHLDMVVAPPHADGSIAGLDSSTHNVHLTKK